MSISSHSYHAFENYVGEDAKAEALARLRERLDAGETVYSVLGIDENYRYYADKLVSGLCPISYTMYCRIMELDAFDAFQE